MLHVWLGPLTSKHSKHMLLRTFSACQSSLTVLHSPPASFVSVRLFFSILNGPVDQRSNLSTQRAEVMDPLSQPLRLMFDSSANSHSMLSTNQRALRAINPPPIRRQSRGQSAPIRRRAVLLINLPPRVRTSVPLTTRHSESTPPHRAAACSQYHPRHPLESSRPRRGSRTSPGSYP